MERRSRILSFFFFFFFLIIIIIIMYIFCARSLLKEHIAHYNC